MHYKCVVKRVAAARPRCVALHMTQHTMIRFDLHNLFNTHMTLPDERYRSIQQARRLLQELCDPAMTPRVASGIRDRARGALRHFPSDQELDHISAHAGHLIVREMEHLHRMMVKYTLDKEPNL